MLPCPQDAYIQCVIGMRNMYHKCRLVHGDLSEYNLLYMEGLLIFIDVSQVRSATSAAVTCSFVGLRDTLLLLFLCLLLLLSSSGSSY